MNDEFLINRKCLWKVRRIFLQKYLVCYVVSICKLLNLIKVNDITFEPINSESKSFNDNCESNSRVVSLGLIWKTCGVRFSMEELDRNKLMKYIWMINDKITK